MTRAILAVFSLLLMAGSAFAQVAFNPAPSSPTASLSVTNSSARVAITAAPTAQVCNTGSNTAYVKFGDSTVVATTTSYPVIAGACPALAVNGGTNMAAITGASTTTLLITTGTGSPSGFGGGSGGGGGGGGAVTVADGADVTQGTTTDAASCASGTTSLACLRQLDADVKGSVPTNPKTTTQAKVTISVTNTYQQALASSAGRTGCTIQYIAVAGTKGFVFFGSSPADTTTSFQLTNGQSLNCAIGGVAVAQDAIQVTGTGTDIFIVSNQ